MVLADAILWILVGLAAIWDLSQRRIPNALVLIGLISAFLLQAQAGGFRGLGLSLLGAAGLLLAHLPFFAMRWMGGGDVKLGMVIGAFALPTHGWKGTLEIFLVANALHGVVAVAHLVLNQQLTRRGRAPLQRGLPFALPLAIATALYTTRALQLL